MVSLKYNQFLSYDNWFIDMNPLTYTYLNIAENSNSFKTRYRDNEALLMDHFRLYD